MSVRGEKQLNDQLNLYGSNFYFSDSGRIDTLILFLIIAVLLSSSIDPVILGVLAAVFHDAIGYIHLWRPGNNVVSASKYEQKYSISKKHFFEKDIFLVSLYPRDIWRLILSAGYHEYLIYIHRQITSPININILHLR